MLLSLSRGFALWAALVVTASASGCFLRGSDDDAGTPADWTFEGADEVILAGATNRVELVGPRRCSGGSFGFGGTCTFSTIESIASSDPSILTIDGVEERVVRLRAGVPGTATLTVVGTTPDGAPTEGSATIRVAAATHAALEIYTACSETMSVGEVAFPADSQVGLVATFQDDAGHTLVGDGAPPFVIDPSDAGAIEGKIVDGYTDFVDLKFAYDVTASEVGLGLAGGPELHRFAIANADTIDGFEIGETTFNPNLNEVYVHARLTAGARHICIGEYDYPFSLEYDVQIETLEVCDAGFGDDATRGVAGFALTPKIAGDCVVTLRHGASLTRTLTIPVVPAP